MSQPLDLSRFPDLPPEVVAAFAAVQFELSVERAARQHEQAVVAEKEAFIAELKELVATLEGQIQQYRRAKFGPKSEKLDPAQLELALEDLETAIAETEARIAAVEEKIAASASAPTEDPEKAPARKPRKARALPEDLPHVERVIEPDSIACPCGCGDMVRIGEDRTRAAGLHPRTLSGDRHGPPPIRLPQGPHRRGAGEGAGASAGGQLADRGAAGPDRRVQAFRAHAAQPPGRGDGAAWGADRPLGAGRLDGPDRCPDRPRGRSHGQAAAGRQHPALCR
jgi:hypothetical protein